MAMYRKLVVRVAIAPRRRRRWPFTLRPTVDGQATVAGTSLVTAAGTRETYGLAAVAGSSAVAAFAGLTFSGLATVAGTGAVSAVGTVERLGIAATAGTGLVTAVGSIDRLAQATVAGVGTVSATATTTVGGIQGSATVVGTSAVVAAGTVERRGQATIAGTSAVNATAVAIYAAQASIAGTSAVLAPSMVTHPGIAAIAGSGAVTATGVVEKLGSASIPGQGLITAVGSVTRLGVVTVSGVGAVNANATAVYAAAAQVSGSGVVSATATKTVFGAASIPGTSAVNASGTKEVNGAATVAGVGAVSATGIKNILGRATVTGLGAVHAVPTALALVKAAIFGTSAVAAVPRLTLGGRATIQGQGTVIAKTFVLTTLPGKRIRVDVYSDSGGLLATGPMVDVLEASYKQELNRIGSFTMAVPSEHERAGLFTAGNEVYIYRENEGLVFRGLVGRVEQHYTPAGFETRITGSSTARRLVRLNVGSTYQPDGVALSTVATALVAGSGFTLGTVTAGATLISADLSWASRWAALERCAKQTLQHFREDVLTAQVDIGPFGTTQPIYLRNVTNMSPGLRVNEDVVPITEVTVIEESDDLWNRLYVLGGGEGTNQLTIEHSTISTPYPVQSNTSLGGATQFFIADAVSIVSYGVREKPIVFKDVIPLANSLPATQRAATALHYYGSYLLDRVKNPYRAFGVQVAGLKQVDSAGNYRFQVGDKLPMFYRGIAERVGGPAVYVDVNQDLWLMGYERRFKSDGSDDWNLTLATTDRPDFDPSVQVADAMARLDVIQVAQKPYTYERQTGPYRDSVDATHPLDFTVRFDDATYRLERSLLTFRVKGLRANFTGAAAGGATAPTTSSGGSSAPTSSAGGAQTATAEGSHTHSISGATSGSTGSHRHDVWADDPDNTRYDIGYPTQGISGDTSHGHTETGSVTLGNSVPHEHFLGSRRVYMSSSVGSFVPVSVHFMVSDAWSGTTTYTYGAPSDHTHSLPGSTSAGGSSHSHSVVDHTHSVTIAAHTHTVTLVDHTHTVAFGITQQSTPGSPGITVVINGVSRTGALGGPWNTGLTLDITQYLQDAVGGPLRAENTISLGSTVLADIEVEVNSLATATSILPV